MNRDDLAHMLIPAPRLPDAACATHDPRDFTGPDPAGHVRAAAVCAACPELAPCREWAQTHGTPDAGVLAGMVGWGTVRGPRRPSVLERVVITGSEPRTCIVCGEPSRPHRVTCSHACYLANRRAQWRESGARKSAAVKAAREITP